MAVRESKEDWTEARGVAAEAESLRGRLASLAEANAVASGAALEALASHGAGQAGSSDRELGASLERAAEVLARIAEAAAARAAMALIDANLVTSPDDERLERGRSLTVQTYPAVEHALAVTNSAK